MIRALMASQKASGLFKRAIIESDPQMYPLEYRTVSRDIVGAFALEQLNCSDVACVRSKNLTDILAASAATQATTPNLDPRVPVTPFSPAIDGTWVKGDWSALIASNSLPNNVDLLIGITFH
jgi:carboxylesterase type B